MVAQAHPREGSVHVRARPGFRRPPGPEIDCVTAMAPLFPGLKPYSGSLWQYDTKGRRAPLSHARAKAFVARACRDLWAQDPHFNVNGIRRMAKAVYFENRPAGILALAQHYVPGIDGLRHKRLRALDKASAHMASCMLLPG